MIHIGFQNYVARDKILAITRADTSPLLRKKQNADDMGKLIDCTKGRMTRSLIHLEGNFMATSAIEAPALIKRFKEGAVNEKV